VASFFATLYVGGLFFTYKNKCARLKAEYLLAEFRPVAHWKLDGTEGTITQDCIGNKDGTLHGNPTWQPTGGKVGGAEPAP
jgi:hypothetical protein